MPVSPAVADPHTTDPATGDPQPGSIQAEYAALVALLLALLAEALAPPPVPPLPTFSWAAALWASLPRFRQRVVQEVESTARRVGPLAREAVADVVTVAVREASRDLGAQVATPDVDGLVRGLMEALSGAHPRIVEVVTSAYRDAAQVVEAAEVAPGGRRGGSGDAGRGDPTPRVQRILDDLARRGVTGYVDAAGRRWNLETYVETTVRARLADAALGTYVSALQGAGVRFAQVGGPRGSGCQRACRDWSGRWVSLDGTAPGTHTVRVAGRRLRVRIKGSYGEAVAAGVWHPWCQHPLGPALSGTTDRSARSQVDRAASRYRGRVARAWDRRTRVALTPAARTAAVARSRAWRRGNGIRDDR